jgi:hypothetical protein
MAPWPGMYVVSRARRSARTEAESFVGMASTKFGNIAFQNRSPQNTMLGSSSSS